MTYREKLELYSQGKLDEQQRIEIEKELEKQEALADYLFEHQAPPGMEDLFDGTSAFGISDEDVEIPEAKDDPDDIAKQINRSIRRAFIKTGAIATIIAFLLTLFIVFALPHIVSAFYYNPDKSIGADANDNIINQMEIDMNVYGEMSFPELGPDIMVGVNSYGYGNYNYYIDSSFNAGESNKYIEKVFTGTIKRDDFVCNNYEQFYKYNKAGDHFNRWSFDEDKSFGEMNQTDLYYAYVAFDENLPYEKFYSDFVNNDEYGTNASWVWCGVNVSTDEDKDYHLKEGFFATTFPNRSSDKYDIEESPEFALLDGSKLLDTEKKATDHFTEMLDYLMNNKFNDMMLNNNMPNVEEEYKAFVLEKGLYIYGFIYVSDKEHIEKVANTEGVSHISVDVVQ